MCISKNLLLRTGFVRFASDCYMYACAHTDTHTQDVLVWKCFLNKYTLADLSKNCKCVWQVTLEESSLTDFHNLSNQSIHFGGSRHSTDDFKKKIILENMFMMNCEATNFQDPNRFQSWLSHLASCVAMCKLLDLLSRKWINNNYFTRSLRDKKNWMNYITTFKHRDLQCNNQREFSSSPDFNDFPDGPPCTCTCTCICMVLTGFHIHTNALASLN